MTQRRIEFIGYGDCPAEKYEKQNTIPDEVMPEIQEHILSAPEGKSAIFVCDDNLQAIKVADRLKLLGYIAKARRFCVYAKRKS